MVKFGLICEGATDHAVLKNILMGYFCDPDLVIVTLQPDRDATESEAINTFGGWYKVLDYCRSDRFLSAFDDDEAVIVVQIDTDCAHEIHYEVATVDANGQKLSVEHIVANVRDKFKSIFIESFGEPFFEHNQHRIIYAISVDEMECWLLPLYYADKIKSATNNCFFRLNEKRAQNNETRIRKDKVGEVSTYQKMSKPLSKNKILKEKYSQNPSFRIFIDDLESKVQNQV